VAHAPPSGLALVNGIELAYQTFGEGDPLILLHGGFGSVEMFGPNVAALAAGAPAPQRAIVP
jgi:pimeloyl-ACP methyl ester carboxylesterase